jgi:glucose-6-phosphate dehydrogenase assembly protein OpcA
MITEISTGLDVVELERELTALWTSMSEEDHDGITRSCVLNLVIYGGVPATDHRLDETLIEVTEHHPSRAIVLIEDHDSAGSTVQSWVVSRCTLASAASRQVCCEQINIKANRDRLREVPSAVASLVLADLPVFLWWRDELQLADPLFRRCSSLADRLLIDTAGVDSHARGFDQVAEFLQSNSRLPLLDLNWTRLQTWRAIIAGFYDVAEHRAVLERMRTVEIRYHAENDERLTPRAAYIAGWLASRLGWQFHRDSGSSEGDTTRLTFSSNGSEIKLILRAVHDAGDRSGHLDQVILTAGSETEEPSQFTVSKTLDGLRLAACVSIHGTKRSERILGYDKWTDSSLLAVELEGVYRDRVFEQSALLAREIVHAVLAID